VRVYGSRTPPLLSRFPSTSHRALTPLPEGGWYYALLSGGSHDSLPFTYLPMESGWTSHPYLPLRDRLCDQCSRAQ